ncbi:hypothetical protein HC891_05810 [Candidatus Gracilibacteria bacterium]|nr:hypothetical protein [Candidatus Gracilibacteria bacterium]
MENQKQNVNNRKYAHSRTYLIGNLTLLFVMSSVAGYIIWLVVPFGFVLKTAILFICFISLAYIEHGYLTGIVAGIVERLFPDEEETTTTIKNSKYRESTQISDNH